MNTKVFALACFLFGFFGKIHGQYCSSDHRFTELPFFDSTEIAMAANVQFGTANDHLGNPYILRMDIYYPNLGIDPSPKRPFVMLFHGGGFTSGDKQSGDIKDLSIHMARRGFVCASVNYRLGFNFTEYGQYKARYRAIQDGHAALRYVVQNSGSLRIDTSWIFVGGQSAGSLLALGLVYSDPAELDSVSLLYNALPVSSDLGNLFTSGNNLNNRYSIKGIFNNWGGIPGNEIDVDEMKPTIAFHGAMDSTVFIDTDSSFLHYTLLGSRSIHHLLVAHQTCSELTVDTNGKHGIFRNQSSAFRAGRASCFFKSVFCNGCSGFSTTDSIPPHCSSILQQPEKETGPEGRLFPNPSDGSFSFEGMIGDATMDVFNSLGQWVCREKIIAGNARVRLPPGMYLLRIQPLDSDTISRSRLIIH